MTSKNNKQVNPEDFSLAVGGPLYRLCLLVGLLKKPLLLYKRRIIFISLLAWLPLFLLAAFGGVAFGGVKVPFIYDIDVHVRFIIALSLLIYAEVIAHDRIHVVVEQFLKTNIISANDRQKFQHIIASAVRLRDSVVAEIVLIVLVYTVGHWISREYLTLDVSNWYLSKINGVNELTPAGYWYVFISLPIFRFILLRWYFRILVWYRFLWQISRLSLQLNSLHPDRAGGLGFLTNSLYAFGPFLLAHTVLLTGMIFNRIWNTGATLLDFKSEIFGVIVFLILIPLVPMLFFMFILAKEKRSGTLKYDVVANHYVNDFRQKWINHKTTKNGERLLGTTDIQSLADLSNSFQVTIQMRITPFGRQSIMALICLVVLPLLPLALTMIPLDKIINQIVTLLF
ncbi:MAG: hypothetical protein SFW66_10745 [Gammaproteobacteria bacterium]|nr:hypothetical protein [Gammaproteobacteria bacterium]